MSSLTQAQAVAEGTTHFLAPGQRGWPVSSRRLLSPIRHPAFVICHQPFVICHFSSPIPHSPFPIPRSEFRIPHFLAWRVPGTPYLIELNHFADGQGKQGHGVSRRAKGATHVSLVPESGWPLPRRGGFIGPKDAQARLLPQGRTGSQSSGRESRSGPRRS